MFLCQKPASSSARHDIEWDENVVALSGRSCLMVCQNVAEKATTLANEGASQILFIYNGIGW